MGSKVCSLKPVLTWKEYNCPLVSLADLACMKLAAIAQRGVEYDMEDRSEDNPRVGQKLRRVTGGTPVPQGQKQRAPVDETGALCFLSKSQWMTGETPVPQEACPTRPS